MTDERKPTDNGIADNMKIAAEQALHENEGLKREIDGLKTENATLKASLDKANELLEGQVRGKLIAEAKAVSKLSNDDLARMTTGELNTFINTARLVQPGKKPITFATETGEDTSPNITIGSLFAFKKKV